MRAPSVIGVASPSNACAGGNSTPRGPHPLCQAAQSDVKGEPKVARAYVVAGLAEAGVTGPDLKRVTAAINPARHAADVIAPGNASSETRPSATPPNTALLIAAQSKFKSGEPAEGYEQVLAFLQKSESSDAPAKTFEAAFVEPVRQTNAWQASPGRPE